MLVFVFLKSQRKITFLIGVLLVSLITAQFIDQQYVNRFDTIFTGIDKEGRSIDLRKEIFSDAFQVFIDHPFGIGVSAFPAIRKATFDRSQDTHNLYLEVATNLGFQGLLVFIFFIYSMMKLLFRIQRDMLAQRVEIINFKKKLDRQVYLSILGEIEIVYAVSRSVFLFIIVRLALGMFGMDLYEIYWWFSLGLAISLSNISRLRINKTRKILENVAKGGMV